ncbi:MAG TPA: quinone oxidoreductase [Xanthobacteraceae bacterium]|nr:quinone oxidoreductase [Xanthobacteraceae bacterium]
MRAIRIHGHGGPEALVLEDLPLPVPGNGQLLVKVKAAGVNLFDTQLRSGLYKRDLPLTLGLEGAGVVDAVGAGGGDFGVGDRVAFIFAAGSYATHALVAAERTVRLPDRIGFEDAAAVLFQGLTAHYLATSTFPLGPGSRCLVHSAAGGCGILLCQIAKLLGAEVIGAVSTPAKAKIAYEAGADHVVIYAEENFAVAARRITSGRGVDVVYDAVGLDTYLRSLDSLRPRGMLVLYGEASGLVPPIDPRELLFRSSLYLTRTGLDHYIADRRELTARTDELFAWLLQGRLQQKIYKTFPLEAAAAAHRAIESRATSGKLLVIP